MFDLEYDFRLKEQELEEMAIHDIISLLKGYYVLYLCISIASKQNPNNIAIFYTIKTTLEYNLQNVIEYLLRRTHTSDIYLDFWGSKILFRRPNVGIIWSAQNKQSVISPAGTPKFIIIVGFSCSGKDTVASLIKEKLGAKLINFSDLLKIILAARRIFAPKRADYYETGDTLRNLFGRDILSKVIISLLSEDSGTMVCVGPRFIEEVKAFPTKKVIGVRVNSKDPEDNFAIRFERYKQRKKLNDTFTLQEFSARDSEEREGLQKIFLSNVIDDWIINNEDDLAFHNVYRQIAELPWIDDLSN